jgi:hypothetical protein
MVQLRAATLVRDSGVPILALMQEGWVLATVKRKY